MLHCFPFPVVLSAQKEKKKLHNLTLVMIVVTVAPLSEYLQGSDEEKQCRHALCLCEMELVRCMGHNKEEIDTTRILHQQCNITGKI